MESCPFHIPSEGRDDTRWKKQREERGEEGCQAIIDAMDFMELILQSDQRCDKEEAYRTKNCWLIEGLNSKPTGELLPEKVQCLYLGAKSPCRSLASLSPFLPFSGLLVMPSLPIFVILLTDCSFSDLYLRGCFYALKMYIHS